MTKLVAMAIPILKGKTEQWKKFTDELKGKYKKEFNESRKKAGVRERTFFQSTPMGDMVIVTLEGENPTEAFKKMSSGTDEFTKWFNSQVKEVHGIDMTQTDSMKAPELIAESEPVTEPAFTK